MYNRLFIILITISSILTLKTYAQEFLYERFYPNYSIEIRKIGSNPPYSSDLFSYDGTTSVIYVVGKTSTAPTIKRAVYQWNIPESELPSVANISKIEVSFEAKFIDYQVSEVNYFNCYSDLTDGEINLAELWSLTDNVQSIAIGSGGINTPNQNNYFTQTHIYNSTSNFVDTFKKAIDDYDMFTLGIAWKYEGPNAGMASWNIRPIKLKVFYTLPTKAVELKQMLSNNQSAGNLKKWEDSNWGQNITPGTILDFLVTKNQTILGDQSIIFNEKYHRWVRNDVVEPAVDNHHLFTIQSGDNSLTSKFEPTFSSIEIWSGVEGQYISGGKVKFKDPWLIDYADPLFGNSMRNRGMKESGMDKIEFKERSSPFYPDYTTNYNGDVYKGVFLNQDFNVPGQPYYSVQAISPQTFTISQTGRAHTFYFQNWSANTVGSNPGAIFQNANSLSTGVVFKFDGAVVSANMKGTQLSSESNAFKPNGQNKIVRISNGRMYQVYESIRKRT